MAKRTYVAIWAEIAEALSHLDSAVAFYTDQQPDSPETTLLRTIRTQLAEWVELNV